MKFADCLPDDIAIDIAASQISDPKGVRRVLSELVHAVVTNPKLSSTLYLALLDATASVSEPPDSRANFRCLDATTARRCPS